ncbi:MAG: SprB repeat-containing protein, partial [Bacteroidota bacterium]
MKKILPVIILLVLQLVFSLSSFSQCSFSVSTVVTNVSCYNGTTGSITVNVTGGTAPFQYQLAEAGAGAWQSGNVFGSLPASTYPVSVKDASGCISTVYVTVSQPVALAATYTANDATCSGSNNGSISITTTGGTAPYSYSWTKDGVAYSTSANISNLSPANYYLTVLDANGCNTTPVITSQIKTISISSGFNNDVIANGTNVAANAATTTAVDNAGSVFYSTGYTNSSGTSGTGGLPSSGGFTSAQTSSRPYQLASYSSNNALVLRSSSGVTSYGGATSGTLTFASQNQSPYATLYVVGTSGSGTGTVNYTVHYSDGTTGSGSFTFPDWYLSSSTSSLTRALGSIGRISYASPGSFDTGNGNNFNLFEAPITVGSPNKVITSVDFAWASSSSTTATSIFAITGYTSTTAGIRINDGASVNVTPSVAVTSDAVSNIFCSGQSVTFTANPANGGTSPAYQWILNGSNISGATSSTYTTNSLANGNQISVKLTSNLSCLTASSATSTALTMSLGTVTSSVSA